MRKIQVITLFPEMFAGVFGSSMMWKAQKDGVVALETVDLRQFGLGPRRQVDDTPYGGGAGMVMKPEPWGLALDEVLTNSPLQAGEEHRERAEENSSLQKFVPAQDNRPLLIVPSPAGAVFNQQMAYELAEEQHIAFAPARYEGIDERVLDWAQTRFRVLLVSMGDYVLYGGEVAVMAMIEAITRLIPGALGNPESLAEESHTGGLLEYPVYTKPAQWRDYKVPPILLSGNHGAIARWRREQQIERTMSRRPDLFEAYPEENWDKKDRHFLAERGVHFPKSR